MARPTPMRDVDELLADLKQSGIRLGLDDAGQLRWSGPRDALTQEFRERIHWLRRDLVATLAIQRSKPAPARTSPSPARPAATDAAAAPPLHPEGDRRETPPSHSRTWVVYRHRCHRR